MKRHRRTLLILALAGLCIGVLGAGGHYWSRGVPMQLQVLFQSVAALSETSEVHDERIQMIVDHIRLMKESLCDIHAAEAPGFCVTDCVKGICDTQGEGDACEGPNPPASCGNPDQGVPGG